MFYETGFGFLGRAGYRVMLSSSQQVIGADTLLAACPPRSERLTFLDLARICVPETLEFRRVRLWVRNADIRSQRIINQRIINQRIINQRILSEALPTKLAPLVEGLSPLGEVVAWFVVSGGGGQGDGLSLGCGRWCLRHEGIAPTVLSPTA